MKIYESSRVCSSDLVEEWCSARQRLEQPLHHYNNGRSMLRLEPTPDAKQWSMTVSDTPVVWLNDVYQEALKTFVFMITERW